MYTDQMKTLKRQNAALRAALSHRLGEGFGGLKKESERFSHDEIVFLFARVFKLLGFDSIKEIRTQYPDCICTKEDKEITIEFEPLLSSFRDHLNKDDLAMCQYIVCWMDDLGQFDDLHDEIDKYNIQVIQLKDKYEKLKTKSMKYRGTFDKRFFRNLNINQKKFLGAFIHINKDILTLDEIRDYTKLTGQGLGGFLSGFTQIEKHHDDWLVRRQRAEKKDTYYELNTKYRGIITELIKNRDI